MLSAEVGSRVRSVLAAGRIVRRHQRLGLKMLSEDCGENGRTMTCFKLFNAESVSVIEQP